MKHSGASTPPALKSASRPTVVNERCTVVVICLFLAAIIWVVFGQTVHFGFVNFDDDVYVSKNVEVTGGLSAKSVAWAFTQVHSSNWHPLTWLSHMLDCQLYELNAGGHHLTNVLLHTATTILLFLALRRLTGSLWRSAFVAAVFSIHPLRVESVAWVAERKDVLSGLFFVLAIWAYVKNVSGVRYQVSGEGNTSNTEHRTSNIECPESRFTFHVSRWYWLCLIFFALALMSKPMVVTLPFVLLLLDYWPLKRVSERVSGARCQVSSKKSVEPGEAPDTSHLTPDTSHLTPDTSHLTPDTSHLIPDTPHLTLPLTRLIVEKITLLALSGAMCLITVLAQKEALSSLPLPVRLGNALVSYVVYLKQMFYPAGLAAFYPYPEGGLPVSEIVAASLLLLVITAMAVAARRKQPWLLVGWLWYLGMLVPVIGILQVGSQAQADRYTYLPQIGLYLALTWTVADWFAGRHCRRLVPVGLSAILLAALMFCAHRQTAYWRNSESLWAHTLECTSDSLTARINFGNALLEAGKTDEAMVHYERALQLRPDDAEAQVSYGYVLIQKERMDEAKIHLQKALEIKPDHAAAHNDLGNVLAQQGRVNEAIPHFRKALQIKPDYAEACYNLGNAFFEQGEMKEAIANYLQALKIKPNYPEACYNLGNALFQTGKLDDAMAQYRRALQIKPKFAKAAYNLGMALLQKGNVEEAIAQFQLVLQCDPANAEAHYNLGNALLRKGRADQAIPHLRQALQIKPDFAEAQNDLAWELATSPQPALRDGRQAVELAERANQVADGKDVDILDTLAAAYAEAGRFEDAARTVRRAIELAQAAGQSDLLSRLNSELKLYEAGRPYHRESN